MAGQPWLCSRPASSLSLASDASNHYVTIKSTKGADASVQIYGYVVSMQAADA